MNYLLVLVVEHVFLFCSGESIKVFVRVRPPDPHLESEIDEAPCLEVTSPSSLTVHSKPEPKHFTFDHVANMHTTQVCGSPCSQALMLGESGTCNAQPSRGWVRLACNPTGGACYYGNWDDGIFSTGGGVCGRGSSHH